MTEQQIFEELKAAYPCIIHDHYPFPKPFRGKGEIKAIILGADPTHIQKKLPPRTLNMVFELDNPKSPYFRSINKNIDMVEGLSMDNVFVQNLCRNYFTEETSQNKAWVDIAKHYWAGFLADELNNMFPPSIPILATTEFLINACVTNGKTEKAENIYEDCIYVPGSNNMLGRDMIAFYRHHRYSLDKWDNYKRFVSRKIDSVG